jgi:PEP-CTERM motif
LVVDFKNGNRYTFGYLYDGTKTAGDMIAALPILPTFIADLQGLRDGSSGGRFINGFGYGSNLRANFPTNFDTTPYTGWNYYVSTSPLMTVTPSWAESGFGVDGATFGTPNTAGANQNLDDHPWNGFSFGGYDSNTFAFQGSAPIVSSAVTAPEPSTLALLGIGIGGVLGFVRRRQK